MEDNAGALGNIVLASLAAESADSQAASGRVPGGARKASEASRDEKVAAEPRRAPAASVGA